MKQVNFSRKQGVVRVPSRSPQIHNNSINPKLPSNPLLQQKILRLSSSNDSTSAAMMHHLTVKVHSSTRSPHSRLRILNNSDLNEVSSCNNSGFREMMQNSNKLLQKQIQMPENARLHLIDEEGCTSEILGPQQTQGNSHTKKSSQKSTNKKPKNNKLVPAAEGGEHSVMYHSSEKSDEVMIQMPLEAMQFDNYWGTLSSGEAGEKETGYGIGGEPPVVQSHQFTNKFLEHNLNNHFSFQQAANSSAAINKPQLWSDQTALNKLTSALASKKPRGNLEQRARNQRTRGGVHRGDYGPGKQLQPTIRSNYGGNSSEENLKSQDVDEQKRRWGRVSPRGGRGGGGAKSGQDVHNFHSIAAPSNFNPSAALPLPHENREGLQQSGSKSSDFDDSAIHPAVDQEETNLQFAKWLEAQKPINYLLNSHCSLPQKKSPSKINSANKRSQDNIPEQVILSNLRPNSSSCNYVSETDQKIVETIATVGGGNRAGQQRSTQVPQEDEEGNWEENQQSQVNSKDKFSGSKQNLQHVDMSPLPSIHLINPPTTSSHRSKPQPLLQNPSTVSPPQTTHHLVFSSVALLDKFETCDYLDDRDDVAIPKEHVTAVAPGAPISHLHPTHPQAPSLPNAPQAPAATEIWRHKNPDEADDCYRGLEERIRRVNGEAMELLMGGIAGAGEGLQEVVEERVAGTHGREQRVLNTGTRSQGRGVTQKMHELKRERQLQEVVHVRDKPEINKKSQQLAQKKITFEQTKKLDRLQKQLFKNNFQTLKKMEDKIQCDKGWNFQPKINENSRKIASEKKAALNADGQQQGRDGPRSQYYNSNSQTSLNVVSGQLSARDTQPSQINIETFRSQPSQFNNKKQKKQQIVPESSQYYTNSRLSELKKFQQNNLQLDGDGSELLGLDSRPTHGARSQKVSRVGFTGEINMLASIKIQRSKEFQKAKQQLRKQKKQNTSRKRQQENHLTMNCQSTRVPSLRSAPNHELMTRPCPSRQDDHGEFEIAESIPSGHYQVNLEKRRSSDTKGSLIDIITPAAANWNTTEQKMPPEQHERPQHMLFQHERSEMQKQQIVARIPKNSSNTSKTKCHRFFNKIPSHPSSNIQASSTSCLNSQLPLSDYRPTPLNSCRDERRAPSQKISPQNSYALPQNKNELWQYSSSRGVVVEQGQMKNQQAGAHEQQKNKMKVGATKRQSQSSLQQYFKNQTSFPVSMNTFKSDNRLLQHRIVMAAQLNKFLAKKR